MPANNTDDLNSEWVEVTYAWDSKAIVHKDDLPATLGLQLSMQMYTDYGSPKETKISLRVLTVREAKKFLAPYQELIAPQEPETPLPDAAE